MAVGAVARGGRTAQTSDCTCPTSQRGRRLVFASLLQMLMGGGMIGVAAGVLGFGSYDSSGPVADAQESLELCYTYWNEMPPLPPRPPPPRPPPPRPAPPPPPPFPRPPPPKSCEVPSWAFDAATQECSNTCDRACDGGCNDDGVICALGTDCFDCGPRPKGGRRLSEGLPSPPPPWTEPPPSPMPPYPTPSPPPEGVGILPYFQVPELSELVFAGGIISVVLGFFRWQILMTKNKEAQDDNTNSNTKASKCAALVFFVPLSIVLFAAATFLALSAADAVSDAPSLANATLTWPLTWEQKRHCREAWARYAGVEFSYDDDYNLIDRTDSRTGEGLLDEDGCRECLSRNAALGLFDKSNCRECTPFAAFTKLDSTGTGDGAVAEVPAQLSLIVGLLVLAAVWAASLGCLVLCCQGADACAPVKEDGDAAAAAVPRARGGAAANIEIVSDAQGSIFGASGVTPSTGVYRERDELLNTGGSAPSTAVYAARGTPVSSAQRAAEQGRVGVATVGGEPVVVQGAIVQGVVLSSNNV